MKQFDLDGKPCRLGASINIRSEKHGTDMVPAADFRVQAMPFTKPELDQLAGKGFWNSVYDTPSGGQPPKPAWPDIVGAKFGRKLEADLTIAFMSESIKPIEITEAKIKGIEFDYQVGGISFVSFTVQTAQDDLSEFVRKLTEHMRSEVKVDIEIREPKDEKKPTESKGQDELPMNHGHEGAEGAGGDDDSGEDGAAESPPLIGVGAEHLGPETRAAAQKAAKKTPAKAKAKAKGKR